eukprot:TRINITY_DN2781_c2_g2_i1.p1 TRINITY_DN2781_c2_g2~~TRINITY_DN2781_c2_g2_i1.p1  ORF type:complete len:532 (+),score=157.59 TRINITY_DN2781_c2_g2_i1:45-1598(+)
MSILKKKFDQLNIADSNYESEISIDIDDDDSVDSFEIKPPKNNRYIVEETHELEEIELKDITEEDVNLRKESKDNIVKNNKKKSKDSTKQQIIEEHSSDAERFYKAEEDTLSHIKDMYSKICSKNPWNRLSKRYKTILIIFLSVLMLVVLIGLIVIPIKTSSENTKYYYISAEEITWNYAPSDKNLITNEEFSSRENLYMKENDQLIGHVYKKCAYVEYEDETFTVKKEINEKEIHKGIIGPIIRAEVGDIIKVVFKNRLDFPVSIHASGVEYQKTSEGIKNYNDQEVGTYGDANDVNKKNINDNDVDNVDVDDGSSIAPGETYTYSWKAIENSGPASEDFSSIVWTYYSAVNSDGYSDVDSGLVGMIIITKKGVTKTNGMPTDVDKELFLFPTIIDENKSHFFEENAQTISYFNETFYESNKMRSINGYMYGNLPDLTLEKGSICRWYIIGMGSSSHSLTWSGQTLVTEHFRSSSVFVYPGATITADMKPIIAGNWRLFTYGDDMKKGMVGLFTVE